MKVCIGADHAGFELKEHLLARLKARGIEAIDVGTHSTDAVDYPDFGAEVARRVSAGECERGILICGAGIGMSMVANKFPGVRAALVGDEYAARMSRRHNDANVLVMGARVIEPASAGKLTEVWLDTEFEGGRHERRVRKIAEIEESIHCRS
ncbi:MAG: ribose 5-phosphate isomerase B [Actinobacteria bacterium]|nr:MAG: ribose 5-phosphate isomerase B [Actinomycetota bacterium]